MTEAGQFLGLTDERKSAICLALANQDSLGVSEGGRVVRLGSLQHGDRLLEVGEQQVG